MQAPTLLLFACLALCQGMSVLKTGPSEDYRVTRGRSGHALGLGGHPLGQDTVTEERKRRHLLSLVSDVLAASWALESARPYLSQGGHGGHGGYGGEQGQAGFLSSLGVRNTADGCYQEACEGGSCQCCNCITCWAC